MNTALLATPPSYIVNSLLVVTAVDTQTDKGPDAKPQPVLLTTDEAVIQRLLPCASW